MFQQSSPPLLVQVVSQDKCQQPSLQKKCGHSNHDVNKKQVVVEKVCLETGQVLASFPSITEAAQPVVGDLFPAICAEVKGTKTSHMGFGWRYSAAEAPVSISTAAAAVQQAAALSSTVGAPVASTQQDDSTGTTPMTKRSPKRIKVTLMLNGETNDDFAHLLAEFPPEGLLTSISFPANHALPPSVTTDCGSDWIEQGGTSTTDSKTAEEVSLEEKKESIVAVERKSYATDSQKSVSKTTSNSRPDLDSSFGEREDDGNSLDDDSLPFDKEESIARKSAGLRDRSVSKIEQVCQKTGKVVRRFDSVKEAAKITGLKYDYIRQSIGYVTNGFLWRVEETNKSPKRSISDKKKEPIEKLSLKTGEVLEKFESGAEAAKSMGVSDAAIFRTSRGGESTCKGFRWRHADSTTTVSTSTRSASSVPAISLGTSGKKPVEMMCSHTGKVTQKFGSVTEAAQAVGVSAATISIAAIRYDGIKSCPGFGWRFAASKKEAPKREHKKRHLSDDAAATRSWHPLKRIRVVVGGETYDELSNLMAEFPQAVSAPRKNPCGIHCDGSDSMPEDTYSESSEVACDSGKESEYDIPSDDHSPDDSWDDDSVPEREKENLDLPSGDEALDKASDDSVFFVEGKSNARKYVRSSMSRPPGRPGMKIEQMCLQTGKLLQRFDSVSEAAKRTGFTYSKIRASMGQVSDGFFWRVEGSTALPSDLEEPTPANVLQATSQKSPHAAHLVEILNHLTSSPSVVPTPSVGASAGKPVEKYCIKTGRLLARFESIAEAALSVGVAPANIMAVVSSLETSKMCMAFGWRHAASADPPPEASNGAVAAVPTNTVLASSHVAGVASVGTYSPQHGDRFRVYYDKVNDIFGERYEAAGWFTGTATETAPLYDKQHLVYLRFDDLSEDKFLFPAPDIQRILPSACEQASNKVFAVDGAGALDLAYECSPDHMEVGDVIFCQYKAPDQAEWHRGRVAVVHENGTCDVVFDGCDHDCNLPKSRFRLAERGRDTKGWLAGLTINAPQESSGKIAPARACRIEDDCRVILTFPDGLEVSRPYEQVAAAVMADSLEKAKAWTHEDAN